MRFAGVCVAALPHSDAVMLNESGLGGRRRWSFEPDRHGDLCWFFW